MLRSASSVPVAAGEKYLQSDCEHLDCDRPITLLSTGVVAGEILHFRDRPAIELKREVATSAHRSTT